MQEHMTTNKQVGFGVAIIIIIAVVVLAIIGYVGYRVYIANTNKPTSTINTTANNQTGNNTQNLNNQTQPTVPYAGWKTYCDATKKACFKYPADWTISTHSDNGINSAVVKNSNNNLEVDYSGYYATDGRDTSYYIASIDDLAQPNASWKVVGRIVSSDPQIMPLF